ncbi:CPBP family intramembrane glutamic endopeptidase [Candidatus Sodalis sp. SoCistrobi]|uniref:CPBP family intramembrane glutamic endopeptidase n=1 Tax=Candidatus Sodalis sp. SoCistrobi TaxID=1922216 RepID=UPI00093C1260|nr:CPBP family intramembrane glutamic endopeptidase [Candidatus Sodalis sp. SoCistrobi]
MEYLLPLSLAAIVVNFRAALVLLALALAVGFWQGYVALPAILFLALAGLIALLRWRYQSRKGVAIICEGVLVIASVMLFIHWVPGFNTPKILDQVQAGPHSQQFTLYYGLDKALIPFLLLGGLPTLFATSAQANVAPWRWALLLLCVPGLLLLAVALGGLAPELHAPVWLGNFMLANLFFVSLAEEALFRGYIQRRLGQFTGGLPALLITALLFGLAHFQSGMLMVIFAGLAGLVYGLAWKWSGKLWLAAAVHFALNMCHLLFFTYPAWRR